MENNNQEELKKAILNIAKYLGLSEHYIKLTNGTLNPKLLIKELILDMFVAGFNFEKCPSQIFNSYMVILNYFKNSYILSKN